MLLRLLALTLLLVPSVAFGQTYWGDYQDSNQTEYLYFPTSDDTGAKVTLTGGALACYEDGSATQFTTGLTLDNDFDSVTGLHQIAVDFSDANFEVGKTYTVVLTAGTADGVTLTGSPLVTFSVGRYSSATDVGDNILDRVLSAVTSPPGATPTVGEGLAWLIWISQAKSTTTETLRTWFAADESTPISEEVLSDAAGTTTKGEAAAP